MDSRKRQALYKLLGKEATHKLIENNQKIVPGNFNKIMGDSHQVYKNVAKWICYSCLGVNEGNDCSWCGNPKKISP